MWPEGLLIKLNQMGVRGRMYQWVRDFLSDRTLRVKIDGELSESFNGLTPPLFHKCFTQQSFFLCFSRLEEKVKLFPHEEHWCGFSPV